MMHVGMTPKVRGNTLTLVADRATSPRSAWFYRMDVFLEDTPILRLELGVDDRPYVRQNQFVQIRPLEVVFDDRL